MHSSELRSYIAAFIRNFSLNQKIRVAVEITYSEEHNLVAHVSLQALMDAYQTFHMV